MSAAKTERAERRTMAFKDLTLRNLDVREELARRLADINAKRKAAKRKPLAELKQMYIWDEGCDALLGLLIGAGGTKTFRTTFKLGGKWTWQTLGRYPALSLAEARRKAEAFQEQAFDGADPRPASGALTYAQALDRYIKDYCKPSQKSWDQTERILRVNCSAWLNRPVAKITSHDARALLRGFVAEGHPAKALITQCWLKAMWRWMYEEEMLDAPEMDRVKIKVEKGVRDRVYSDDEIRAIWLAADKLGPQERAFVKLLLLLAPRKTALALMERKHLKGDVWITPPELVKAKKSKKNEKRTYQTPLPPLAQRELKGLPSEGRLFPELPITETRAGRRVFRSPPLTNALIRNGAPSDFAYHTLRHTIATWLENEGHSEWERGLILNHVGSGVTAGYSHGHALDLKRTLLNKWADYVEGLVTPKGVSKLR